LYQIQIDNLVKHNSQKIDKVVNAFEALYYE